MPLTSYNERLTEQEREVLLDQLDFLVEENNLGQMLAFEEGDMEGFLYCAGVADGLRQLAAHLCADITILQRNR